MKQQILEESVDDMLNVFKNIILFISMNDLDSNKLKIIKVWSQNTRYNILQRLGRENEITKEIEGDF